MKRRDFAILAVVLGLLLMVSLMASLRAGPAVSPAQAAVPTPMASVQGGGDWSMVTYVNTNTIATGPEVGEYQTARYEAGDFQHKIQFGSSQTVTCKLQYSNDTTTWDDGPTIINAASADATGIAQEALLGRYSRITCTLTTAGTEVTITIKAKVFN